VHVDGVFRAFRASDRFRIATPQARASTAGRASTLDGNRQLGSRGSGVFNPDLKSASAASRFIRPYGEEFLTARAHNLWTWVDYDALGPAAGLAPAPVLPRADVSVARS